MGKNAAFGRPGAQDRLRSWWRGQDQATRSNIVVFSIVALVVVVLVGAATARDSHTPGPTGLSTQGHAGPTVTLPPASSTSVAPSTVAPTSTSSTSTTAPPSRTTLTTSAPRPATTTATTAPNPGVIFSPAPTSTSPPSTIAPPTTLLTSPTSTTAPPTTTTSVPTGAGAAR